jgi:hypothetical protein
LYLWPALWGWRLLGYWFTLRSDLRSKGAEARLAIQRQAIDDVQQALKTFWVAAAKLLRVSLEERLRKAELLSKLEEAGTVLTVGHSRLQDRQLADDVADWHHATALKVGSTQVLSKDEVSSEHKNFVALSDRLGARLRELTAVHLQQSRQ